MAGCLFILLYYCLIKILSTVWVEGLNDTVFPNQLCLESLKKVEDSNCSLSMCQNHSFCSNNIDAFQNVSRFLKPILLCRDENSLTFTWNHIQPVMFYYMRIKARKTNEIICSESTRCNYLTLNKLNEDEEYFVTLYSLLSDGSKIIRGDELLAKTIRSKSKRNAVKALNYTLALVENSYSAIIKWQPGLDLSCLYEIVWYEKHDPGEYIYRRISLKRQLIPEYNLTNLEFGKKYYFSIMSVDKSGASEGSKKWLKIFVPTCLNTFKNLSICAPNKPANLTVKIYPTEQIYNSTQNFSLPIYSVRLNWKESGIHLDYYSISIMSFSRTSNESFAFNATISGDQNTALLEKVQLGSSYVIKLIAYSRGGASAAAYVRGALQNYLNSTETTKVTNNQLTSDFTKFHYWLWFGFSTLFLFFFICIFGNKILKCRSIFAKRIVHDATIIKYTASETDDSQWELVESKLLIDKVIGFGAFGLVQKGHYYLEPNKKAEVAVKTIKAKSTDDQISQFYDEIEIMKSVPRHAHIVYLIGVITKHRERNPLMLVEFCAGGNLQALLRKVALDWVDSSTSDKDVNNKEYQNLDCSVEDMKFSNKTYDFQTELDGENKHFLESKDLMSFARQIIIGMVLESLMEQLAITQFSLHKKKLPFQFHGAESVIHTPMRGRRGRTILPLNNINSYPLCLFLGILWKTKTGHFGLPRIIALAKRNTTKEFLSNLKLIHRDLAARNILISANDTLKISDFGLSRDIYTESIYRKITNGKVPIRWMALESLTHQVYTTESDVWSFGIVLWEIVTLGANPYPTINTEDLINFLRSGYRMDRPINCSEELYQIMLQCWQTSSNRRPSFKYLRELFDKLLESEVQYISLEDAKKNNLSHYENIVESNVKS